MSPACGRKVVVTGLYDRVHSGHVRFVEDLSAIGKSTVCLGNNACIRELKGEGHPLLTRGMGWLVTDVEIYALQPD